MPVPSNCLASTPLRVALFLVSTFKIRDTLIRVAHDPGRRPSLYRFRVMNSTGHDRCAHHDIAILGRTTADGAAVSEPRRRHVGDSESDLRGVQFAQGPGPGTGRITAHGAGAGARAEACYSTDFSTVMPTLELVHNLGL